MKIVKKFLGNVLFWMLMGPAAVLQRVMIELSGLIELIEINVFRIKPQRVGLFSSGTRFSNWFYNQFAFPFQRDDSIKICLLVAGLFWLVLGYLLVSLF
jgi:hypothetical protein